MSATDERVPAVCVVIPCYNVRRYLEECLRSVVAQDFADWEAIVVDDCSTDGDPAEIVAAVGDPRVRLMRHAVNRGLAAARNTGFAATRSPRVLPLDSDDVLAPAFLSRVRAVLERDLTLDCAFPQFLLFGEGRSDFLREFVVEPVGNLTERQWLPGPGVLMKRALWERAGGYGEDATLRLGNEDWDFWLSAAELDFRAAHLPEPLYRYRQHGANMSDTLRAQDHLTRELMLRRHRALFERLGTGRRFLAEGYWRSADVARLRGRALSSLALGSRAALLDGDWRRLRRLTQNNVSARLPAPLRRVAQTAAQRVLPS